MPGPGVYESRSFTTEGPSFSFRPRLVAKNEGYVPGPGKYNPNSNSVEERSPAWPVGKSEKSAVIDVRKNSPGPGTYDKNSTLSGPRWGFGP